MEVRSPFAGRIIETFSSEGDEINVGEPLFVIIPVDGEEAVKDLKIIDAIFDGYQDH